MDQAIWLNLPPTGTKCVSEEVHINVVVLADYVVIPDDHSHQTPTISAKVNFISLGTIVPIQFVLSFILSIC